MIGIDSNYLHKMVPHWHRHWHFHANESCYSSSNSPSNPWKPSHVTRKMDPGLARNFEKFGPNNSRKKKKKTEICPKFSKLHLLWFDWLKFFRFGNLKNFRLRPLVQKNIFWVTEIQNFSPESRLIWQYIFLFLSAPPRWRILIDNYERKQCWLQ